MKDVPILIERPPQWIWDKAHELFSINDETAIFTYGDAIYNPGNGNVAPELYVHELVHVRQQEEIGPDAWWQRFFDEPEFRFYQELEAYQQQYKAFCDFHPDRNVRARFLHMIAGELAGETYGGLVDHAKAQRIIRFGGCKCRNEDHAEGCPTIINLDQ